MSFITDLINKITNFRVKIGDKLNTLKNQIGQLNSLTTNDKTSLVGAVNEVNRNIPTVNNGQLTLSTETGLSGSTNFTANQSGNSTFSVAVASTHKLPTTAEWASALVNTTYTAGTGLSLTDTTFSVKYGTEAGTAAQGNDERINNGQTAFNSLGKYVLRTNLNARSGLLSSVTGGSDFYYSPSNDPDKPTGVVDGAFISMSYDNDSWYTQLYADWRTNEWYVRTKNSGTWNSFQKLIHTGNISTHIPAQVNLTQGAGIGITGTYPNLTITNTAPNATHTGDVTGSTALTIANSAVTHAKYQNIATQRILGRGATGTGNVQELTLGANLSLSTAGVLSATGNNTTYSAGNGLTLSGTTFSLPVTTSGSGNVVSEVTQTTNGITVNKGISAMTTSHVANSIDQNLSKSSNPTFNSIELSAPIPHIDFHFDNSTEDYTSRIIEESLGSLNLISKDSLKYKVDGATTPFLEIDKRGAIIGSNTNLGFEAVYLKTTFGSLDFDDEGFNYRPKDTNYGFGISADINAYYDMYLAGKLNDLKIKGRGSLGSPTNLLTGNNLTNYLFGDVSNKDGLATFRVDNNITKDGGIPVFAQWGASILAQTSDNMFTLSANPNAPEIFVSAGTTSNNINWNKKLAFSDNKFPLYAQAFYENSLRELKENIKPFNKSGIELINSLDIVTFDRKDSEVKNKIGIIADDSIDEVLSTKKDAVDLYNTVFIQAKAIQELDSKNKTLEERISQLEEIIKNML